MHFTDRNPSSLLARLTPALLLLGLAWAAAGVANAQHPTAVTSIINSAQDTTLEVNHNGSLLAPGTYNLNTPADSIPTSGAGTRMMWYPAKAAFRTGRLHDNTNSSGGVDGRQFWNTTNVGFYSVALGENTKASGSASTAMGSGTTASGPDATAMGSGTTASDFAATAMGSGATASGRSATAMGALPTASGNFTTAMGLSTTAATSQSLSIGTCNSANTSADNTLFVAGNGNFGTNTCDGNSDALVLKKDGDLAVGPSDPQDLRLFVQDEKDNAGVQDNPKGNMVLFENTSTGTKPDVMGLQAGPSSPTAGVAYLTFYDRTGTTVGQVEGNGSGGVNYESAGADFAEELSVADGEKVPEAADLVGVRGGKASLETEGAGRVMIASTAPIMTGNATPSTTEDNDERVAVAFVGQVPAKVRGTADVGDLIVASGKNDGTGQAVAPSEYRRAKHGPIVGQAWSSKEMSEIGEVTVAVGLGRSGAVAERMEDQDERIAELKAENQEIKDRLAALEAQRSPSAIAGLTGSTAILLLGLVLGGMFGAGLLWRRRD